MQRPFHLHRQCLKVFPYLWSCQIWKEKCHKIQERKRQSMIKWLVNNLCFICENHMIFPHVKSMLLKPRKLEIKYSMQWLEAERWHYVRSIITWWELHYQRWLQQLWPQPLHYLWHQCERANCKKIVKGQNKNIHKYGNNQRNSKQQANRMFETENIQAYIKQ